MYCKWSKAEIIVLMIAIFAANFGWWLTGYLLKNCYAP